MTHNYGYDINRIIYLSNEQGLSQIEGFTLNLDSTLSELNSITPEYASLLDSTIELLYGLVEKESIYK